jgi:bacterial leucyl aminopeptidase
MKLALALFLVASSAVLQVTAKPAATQHAFLLASNDEAKTLELLALHDDPVDVMIAMNPASAETLGEPRLLDLLNAQAPRWLTEGDKLRLKRKGLDFIDLTGRSFLTSSEMDKPRKYAG